MHKDAQVNNVLMLSFDMIKARKIVENGPSEASAFSAILRALIMLTPNKLNINYINIHPHTPTKDIY